MVASPSSSSVLDAIQRRLNFDWEGARRHPQFRDSRGLGRVAVAGFALGMLFGVHLTLLLYTLLASGLAARTWLVGACVSRKDGTPSDAKALNSIRA